jgi:hypothetical protein
MMTTSTLKYLSILVAALVGIATAYSLRTLGYSGLFVSTISIAIVAALLLAFRGLIGPTQ